jgi:hypothetical protein
MCPTPEPATFDLTWVFFILFVFVFLLCFGPSGSSRPHDPPDP